ncbi:MAG: class I SAM-dependent methyltransferase [Anaerolineaceae bacterium]|nr:class I SAM-dependent methyltransferase [Anaerolineaceae bacterium]
MFNQLWEINTRPEPFSTYTADTLWTDPHTSKQMLSYHLNEILDMASRNKKFIQQSIEWIDTTFFLGDSKRVCDFGCGPGLYTIGFAKKGASVTGVDFSKGSLDYARTEAKKAGLDILYVHQNYLEFESDAKYDLITMIMCDFCALSPEQRKMMLNQFQRLLNDGGKVLLDVYSLKGFESREESSSYAPQQLNGFWSKNDYYGFMNTFKYADVKVVLDKYSIIEVHQTRVIYNWLQYFSEETLKSEIQESGFEILGIYDDVAGSEYTAQKTEFAVVLGKAS